MKKFLCVGINNFLLSGNNLNGCVADAEVMRDIFRSMGRDLIVLQDKEATKKTVLANLSSMVNATKKGAVSYLGFTYSAHGTHYPRPEEPDGLGEALVCYDTVEKDGDWNPDTIIKDSELHSLLNQVPLSCTVEVWLDTCYSGGMDKAGGFPLNPSKGRYLHNPSNPGSQIRLATTGMSDPLCSNIIIWEACSEAQTSADAYISGGYHGAFTWFWTQEFMKNPKASRVQLLVRTRGALRTAGFSQFPRLKCWNAKAQG